MSTLKKGPGRREISIKENQSPRKWRILRWISLIFINLFFFASFYFDIQILEGSLSASRFLGLHLADPFASLQIMLASKMVKTNLVIGLVTIVVLYILIGGRSFCSWVCPYGALSEIAEFFHKTLRKKGLIKFKNQTFNRKIKYYLFFVFLILAFVTGFTVFEFINPVSGLSRSFVYGPSLILVIVFFMLALEVLFSKRAWCKYFCPVGVSYISLGMISPVKIHWDPNKCSNCKECQAVCMVPFVLKDTVNKGIGEYIASGECTRCGLCVDVCDDTALTPSIKYLDKLI
ncbi:MAG: quinol dehydrogenase ferredoxin subunit NapH [Bacteriovoracaceae bacterium]|jgi:ferredoxin-type protein NapH|nr:quinol dehydrogenase ferredoxin subunit NapH [Bacteriovoracaceae bacterium]